MIKYILPAYLVELLFDTVYVRTGRLLRSGENRTLLASCIEKFKQSFLPPAIKLWNPLQIDVRLCSRLSVVRLDPLCHCGTDNKTVEHFFLYYPRFAAQRTTLVASAEQICGLTWLESNDH